MAKEERYSLHNVENIMRAKKDKEYLGELLMENEDLIWFSIHNYVGDPVKLAIYNGMEKDDIQQVGRIGFIKAIKNFDCNRGILFTTYAPSVIAGEVKSYLRDHGRLLKLPRSAYDLNIKIMNYTEDIYYDKFLSVEEIAEQLNEDVEKIKKVLTVGSIPTLLPLRRKERYRSTKNTDEASDCESVDETIDIESQVIERIYLDQVLDIVRSKLSERDRRVLDSKLEGKTHEQVANEEDISKITVTRILNKVRKIIQDTEK